MKNSIELILNTRQQLKLSQHALAKLLGVSRDVVANWETKRARVPGDIVLTVQKMLTNAAKPTISNRINI
jgi:DNA-binding transcriptional regulator YiaG